MAQPEVTERQARILSLVEQQGFATIENLAAQFEVSAQTIRRDIIALDSARLLRRFHGGAGLPHDATRRSYEEKKGVAVVAKARIGRAAAALAPAGGSVFLDVGTTAEAAARALRQRAEAGEGPFRVFTASLPAALALAGVNGVALFLLGGEVRTPDGAVTGSTVTAAVHDLRFELALIGASGFDGSGAPLDFEPEKIAVKRVAAARARHAWLIADASKHARTATMRVLPAGELTGLVTDSEPPRRLATALRKAGARILVAGEG